MKNNTWYLTRQRFNTLFFHKGRIITFCIFLVIFLALDLVSLMTINTSNAILVNDIIMIVDAFVFGLLMIIFTLSIFRGEIKSNQINLELREGYKARQIYSARIFELIFDFAVFMVIASVINVLVIFIAGKIDNPIWYHMYLASLGWYAIIGIISIGMAGFFCAFMGSGWAGTISTIIMIICVLLGGFVNGLVSTLTSSKYQDDNAPQIAKNILYSDMQKFLRDDLGISSLDQWQKIEGQFVDESSANWKSPEIDPYWRNENNVNPTKINTGLYITPGSSTPDDWEVFYRMMSGNWYNDNTSGYSQMPAVPYFADIFADFAGFGYGVLNNNNDQNPSLAEFFNDSHEFFKSHEFNFNYSDITNWNILTGDVNSGFWGTTYGSSFSNENIKPFLDSMTDSKEMSKYTFIKRIDSFMNVPTVSSLFNSEVLQASGNNVDNNERLYPLFGIGGYDTNDMNGVSINNAQILFKAVLNKLKMTPAEYVFNRDVMYWCTNTLLNMNNYLSPWKNSTWISEASIENYSFDDGTYLYLYVYNSGLRMRQDGWPLNNTTLKKGYLKDLGKHLTITHSPRNYSGFDDTDNSSEIDLSNAYFNGSQIKVPASDVNYSDNLKIVSKDQDFYLMSCINDRNWVNSKTDITNYSANNVAVSSVKANDSSIIVNTFAASPEVIPGTNMPYTVANKTDNNFADVDDSAELNNLEFTNSKGETAKGTFTGDNGLYTMSNPDVDFSDGIVHVSYKNPEADNLPDLSLINGDVYRLPCSYGESKTHSTETNLIYNPMVQLSSMFNGVNYREPVLQNILDSYISENMVGVGGLIIQTDVSVDNNSITVSAKRVVYPEITYIEYLVIEAAFLFAAYWMYRKRITS